MKERRQGNRMRNRLLVAGSIFLFLLGGTFLWAASLKIPDLSDLSETKVAQSTKIYDSTGKILLYDMSPNVKRTVVPFEDISQNVKNATIAIEDKNFYHHGGVDFSSLARAFLVDIETLSFSQGGSTITQQVVKNVILNNDKTPTRKIKELILSEKLEQVLTKDQILNLYLNEIPYGGDLYGVEEASQSFFGVSSSQIDLAQSAYLAAMINAPTYYSPYGPNTAELDARKNTVLADMLASGVITQDQYASALKEVVTFLPRENTGIKAPHFVFFVINELAQTFGEDALETGGLKVITTLNWDVESKAEALAKQYGDSNQTNFNADNNATVAIDPTTGNILAMVGSRDYFDTTIDGNFNAATAHRQPGSTFKPFVYSTLFEKGYTPDTILFDVPTQFNPSCQSNNFNDDPTVPNPNGCYAPVDYDGDYRGPMTIRDALAQSINIPAIQAIYLAGVQDSINTATNLGIQGLGNADQYGLSLVLGGAEVSPLDLTSAYSVFANDGIRNPYNAILEVQDSNGQVLQQFTPSPQRVLPAQTARQITSILSDNVARTPAYGPDSVLYIPNQEVAVKTGTTNDFKDAWIMGYTPNLAVGMWVGNNDNTPMDKKVAGYIVAPMWRALMNEILPEFPVESFTPPTPTDPTIKPVLRGDLLGERAVGGIHSILYFVDKDDPLGPAPTNPAADPQYNNWEYADQTWLSQNPNAIYTFVPPVIPTTGTSTPTTTTPIPAPAPVPTTSTILGD